MVNHKIICGDSKEILKRFKNESIDLVVTSPPYDNLRDYNGYSFDFKNIARELYRIIKIGGICVWIVGDQTIDSNETGTSFKQVLYFKEIGFKLYDSMIYEKNNFSNPSINRYHQIFEYMFILTKNYPKTFNPLLDKKNRYAGESSWGKNTVRQKDGSLKEIPKHIIREYGMRNNIWKYNVGKGYSTTDEDAFLHPAIFPEKLANDHIRSWSNEDDIILDPFVGSGTTLIECERLNRNSIGVDISKKYCELSYKRLLKEVNQIKFGRDKSKIEKIGF